MGTGRLAHTWRRPPSSRLLAADQKLCELGYGTTRVVRIYVSLTRVRYARACSRPWISLIVSNAWRNTLAQCVRSTRSPFPSPSPLSRKQSIEVRHLSALDVDDIKILLQYPSSKTEANPAAVNDVEPSQASGFGGGEGCSSVGFE